MAPPTRRLRVLTFNTWLLRLGPWTVARQLAARAERIPQAVADTGADLVALQEVWPLGLAASLAESLRSLGYAHAAFGTGRSGGRLLGDGLLIVSRHPLGRPRRLTFSGRNVWYERFIAKGALAADVALPWGETLRLTTAHLAVVRFDFQRRVFRQDDARTRASQLEQLADWSEEDPVPPRHRVLAADLNLIDRPFADGAYADRDADEYRRLLDRLQLVDAYRQRDGRGDGFTFDPATNAHAARGRCRRMPGERIDYVLYRRGTGLRAEAARLVFREAPLLSDHYGLLAELAFE